MALADDFSCWALRMYGIARYWNVYPSQPTQTYTHTQTLTHTHICSHHSTHTYTHTHTYMQEFFERLWEKFSDNGAKARAVLMRKKEEYRHQKFQELLRSVLTYTEQPHGDGA